MLDQFEDSFDSWKNNIEKRLAMIEAQFENQPPMFDNENFFEISSEISVELDDFEMQMNELNDRYFFELSNVQPDQLEMMIMQLEFEMNNLES